MPRTHQHSFNAKTAIIGDRVLGITYSGTVWLSAWKNLILICTERLNISDTTNYSGQLLFLTVMLFAKLVNIVYLQFYSNQCPASCDRNIPTPPIAPPIASILGYPRSRIGSFRYSDSGSKSLTILLLRRTLPETTRLTIRSEFMDLISPECNSPKRRIPFCAPQVPRPLDT